MNCSLASIHITYMQREKARVTEWNKHIHTSHHDLRDCLKCKNVFVIWTNKSWNLFNLEAVRLPTQLSLTSTNTNGRMRKEKTTTTKKKKLNSDKSGNLSFVWSLLDVFFVDECVCVWYERACVWQLHTHESIVCPLKIDQI